VKYKFSKISIITTNTYAKTYLLKRFSTTKASTSGVNVFRQFCRPVEGTLFKWLCESVCLSFKCWSGLLLLCFVDAIFVNYYFVR